MLDTKTTFDQLVADATRATEEQAQRILDNRFYRNIAGALSGTQEYMAMEKLYELHDRGGFDLIVVDTPPTRHALDFLDAPRRLTRLLDNRDLPHADGADAHRRCASASVAAQAFLRTDLARRRHRGRRRRRRLLPRVRGHGGGLPRPRRAGDAAARGRRDRVRARHVAAARRGRGGASSSPSGSPTASFAVDALVVNRVHPQLLRRRRRDALRDARARARRPTPSDARGTGSRARYANLADFEEVAGRERRELAGLEERIGDASVAHVPELGHDVHDFAALAEVGEPPRWVAGRRLAFPP